MLVHRTLLLWIRNFLKGHGQFDKGHGQFWIRACVHVQCKQVELCRFRYGTEFVRTCVDVVSNYMYQSNNFFGVVQLFKTTTLSSVCIQTLVNLFWNSRQFTHYNNKLERQHSCITSQVTYGLILMSDFSSISYLLHHATFVGLTLWRHKRPRFLSSITASFFWIST